MRLSPGYDEFSAKVARLMKCQYVLKLINSDGKHTCDNFFAQLMNQLPAQS